MFSWCFASSTCQTIALSLIWRNYNSKCEIGLYCPVLCPTEPASNSYSFQLQGALGRAQGEQTEPETTVRGAQTFLKWRGLISTLVCFKEHTPQRSHTWTANCGLSTLEATGQTLERDLEVGEELGVIPQLLHLLKLLLCPSLAGRSWRPELLLYLCLAALKEVTADELFLHPSSQLEAINTFCSSFFILPWKNFIIHSSIACRTALPSSRGTDDTAHWEVMKAVLESRENTAIFPVQRNSHQQAVRRCSEGAERWANTENGTHGHTEWNPASLPADCRGWHCHQSHLAQQSDKPATSTPSILQSMTFSRVHASFIFLRTEALLQSVSAQMRDPVNADPLHWAKERAGWTHIRAVGNCRSGKDLTHQDPAGGSKSHFLGRRNKPWFWLSFLPEAAGWRLPVRKQGGPAGEWHSPAPPELCQGSTHSAKVSAPAQLSTGKECWQVHRGWTQRKPWSKQLQFHQVLMSCSTLALISVRSSRPTWLHIQTSPQDSKSSLINEKTMT